MKKPMTPIHLRLPSALLKQIDRLVSQAPESLNQNRTDLIRSLLVEAIDAREEEDK